MSDNDDAILARLNGDFRRVAEIVGVEKALRISQEFGGEYISIPKLDGLRRTARDASIRKDYDESPDKSRAVRRLARKHNLTMAQIYNILGKQPADTEPVALPLFFQTEPLK
jgi:Mor family transcriptional regulator